ncbi:MAG: thioredoxin domain-containing protein, partial [Myxococcaceae bacterium]
FGRAREEDKPVFLSVGYSTCHWCHVMAHESFEDRTVAALLNEAFVCVKVDREERPDLDQLYQGVAQLFGRGGGWPLTVFLTPELRPFYGGTYFPPSNRGGLPGLPRVLLELSRAFSDERAQVEAQARSLSEDLGKMTSFGLDEATAALDPGDVVSVARELERELDPVNGGFGTAPKFPMVSSLELLLRGWRRTRDPSLSGAALLSLERMAGGGLYDQLGGGFHRYSTDGRWAVPHFEKMLYDNAQLLHLLAEAQQVEPRPLWRKAAAETAAYVAREMTSPGGGFYATQDADSEGEEGRFFVWTPSQVDEELPPPLAALARAHFGVTEGGNFEHGATVLHLSSSAEELAAQRGVPAGVVIAELSRAQALLFEAREKRVKPARDEKILAGWNGLMIRGLSLASRVFHRPEWATLARGAADHVLGTMWRDGRLMRTGHGGAGFLEDYGDLAAGLCALYQATFEPRYLEAARALSDRAVELFWDEAQRAYLTAPRGQKDLIVPAFALFDEACPSGASMLTEAQVTLAALTDDARLLELPERYLARMGAQARKSPLGFSHLWLAADAFLDGAAEVTLDGPSGELDALVEVTASTYAPTVALRRGPVQGRVAAHLCRRFSCLPPLSSPEALREALTH